GRRSRRRPAAERRLAAHPGPDEQGGLEQAVEHRAGLGPRCFPRLAHLALDLRLAEDHRVEARRDAVKMAHRRAVALEVAVLAGIATGTEALAQDGPDRLGRRVARFGEVEFGAVA